MIDSSQKRVIGDVKIKLLKGNVIIEGYKSPYSLMNPAVAVYGEENSLWTGAEAAGFCKLYGLQSILASNAKKIGDTYEKKLFDRFTSTTRATLKSTFIVGSIQGILGGLLFWVTGIPGALVWGVVMTALSVIPAIGSFLVWLPAGIIMMAMGNIAQGLTIIIFGSFVIGTIDNILRPPLIGKDIQMHPILILFSTIGGLGLFGVTGVVIGPIIAAFFLGLLDMYELRYKKQLDSATT